MKRKGSSSTIRSITKQRAEMTPRCSLAGAPQRMPQSPRSSQLRRPFAAVMQPLRRCWGVRWWVRTPSRKPMTTLLLFIDWKRGWGRWIGTGGSSRARSDVEGVLLRAVVACWRVGATGASTVVVMKQSRSLRKLESSWRGVGSEKMKAMERLERSRPIAAAVRKLISINHWKDRNMSNSWGTNQMERTWKRIKSWRMRSEIRQIKKNQSESVHWVTHRKH